MNICCTINEKYIRPLKILLCSLMETQTEEINFYLVSKDLTSDEIQDLKNFTEALEIKFHFIPFPEKIWSKCQAIVNEKLSKFPNGSYTVENFFRLFLHEILPESVHKLLYIDTDIVVIKNLFNFYHINFNDKTVIATPDVMNVLDSFKENLTQRKKNLEIPDDHPYFNAGVLLLNLDKIRKNKNFSADALIKTIKEKDFGYHDQDVLNFLLTNDCSTFTTFFYNAPVPYQDIADLNKSYILHYLGYKPWDIEESKLEQGKAFFYHRLEKIVNIIEKLTKKLNNYENSDNFYM